MRLPVKPAMTKDSHARESKNRHPAMRPDACDIINLTLVKSYSLMQRTEKPLAR